MEIIMRKIYAIAALGLAILAFGGAPAMAQEAQRDQAISSCTIPPVSAEACNAAIQIYLAVLETLPNDEADDLLADLVNVLAVSSSPETRAVISAAIVTVAAEFNDPVRAEAAVQVADAVAEGTSPDIVLAQLASAN
jgi:hypothetical protein